MSLMKKSFLLLFISASFVSCSGRFEPDVPVKAGSRKGMRVNNESVTLLPGGYYNYSTIKLDANRDGTDDFIFSLGYWGSPGMGMKLHSSLSSAHDGAFIFGTETNDTVFVRSVRTYSNYEGNIVAYTLTQSDCMRRTAEHLPKSVNKVFTPSWLNEGDAIGGAEDNFQKTGFSFVYTDSWPTNSTFINDTLWVSRSESRFDCHATPDGPSVYIGIAMIEDGKFKKGWIRFRLEGPVKINFEEMAFQR
ncbi:MAG: hypothetical protein LWX09_00065 [Bacteroidia bacterium]|nr:hypothetical protein [Bacteroidia bacterium]